VNAAYLAFLFAAFWVAVGLYRGRHPWQFLASLVAGAGFAHLGWLALHAHTLADPQSALLDLTTGFSVLLFPLGPLLISRWDPDAWMSLPLALAVARLGCLASGCCGGLDAAWGTHPTPLYEVLCFVSLFPLVRRAPREYAGAVFLAAFGVIRLVIEPFRMSSATLVSPALLASAWVLVAIVRSRAVCRRFGPRMGSLAILGSSGCGVSMVAPSDESPESLLT